MWLEFCCVFFIMSLLQNTAMVSIWMKKFIVMMMVLMSSVRRMSAAIAAVMIFTIRKTLTIRHTSSMLIIIIRATSIVTVKIKKSPFRSHKNLLPAATYLHVLWRHLKFPSDFEFEGCCGWDDGEDQHIPGISLS